MTDGIGVTDVPSEGVDVTWVRIRSWHVVKTPTRVPNRYVTRCGRSAFGPDLDERPGNEATCETCLRLAGPR
jgi:hypothetical protein